MTNLPNANEAEFWSGAPGQKWINHEAEQDRFLSAVANTVLRIAAPRPGERVLDIGCGTGALTLAMAEAVGQTGRVLATDIAPPFIARTAERTAHLPQVGTLLADAQIARWPEADFDHAVSRFGVMFFADPPAAFANIASALKPGGTMTFAAWDATENNPYWLIPRDLIDSQLGPRPRPDPNAPGPMGLADAGWTLEQFRQAGLAAQVDTLTVPLLHDGGAAGAAGLAIRIGPAARGLAEAEADQTRIQAFRSAAERAIAPYEVDGQARIPASIHIYRANRP